MTAEDKANAIMDDIKIRKGLGKIWEEYWKGIDNNTREAIVDAWAKIIKEAGNEG
jgi:hypothetical protein